MGKHKLYEVVLPTDRWSARAISPIDISKGIDNARYGKTVVVHPGWGKSPKRHAQLLIKLADSGFLPIGVDTRYAYADRQRPRQRLALQQMRVGSVNSYFENADMAGNRWKYRRPTVLLEICRRLGVEERSYIGHSDGGRIVALAASAQPESTRKLIVVNGAGTGDSSNGLERLVRSNANRVKEFAAGDTNMVETTVSALGSIAYAVSHPRRLWAEKHVIQTADTWQVLGGICEEIDTTVLHAVGDELISFTDCAERSESYPKVEFIPTLGGHSNMYEPPIQQILVDTLR